MKRWGRLRQWRSCSSIESVSFGTAYPAAVACVTDDLASLTVHLRFPAEHWKRIRHSNFIERTFGETRRRVKVIGRLPARARACRWCGPCSTGPAAAGAPLAEVGAGLVDGLRGSTLLTRRQGFGTGTPVAISLTVTDLDQPGSGWSGTIGVVAALGGEPIPPPLTLGPNFAFQSGHGTLLEPGGPLTNGNGIRAFAVSGAAACPPPAGTLRCPDWSTPLDGTSSVSPVLGEALYVGTNAGTMYPLDPATGAIQWSTSVGAAISAPAAVADGTVFVPTADGRLVALDAATGGRSWTASMGVELGVQPAVAGGRGVHRFGRRCTACVRGRRLRIGNL